jgi:hypothetical protein
MTEDIYPGSFEAGSGKSSLLSYPIFSTPSLISMLKKMARRVSKRYVVCLKVIGWCQHGQLSKERKGGEYAMRPCLRTRQ